MRLTHLSKLSESTTQNLKIPLHFHDSESENNKLFVQYYPGIVYSEIHDYDYEDYDSNCEMYLVTIQETQAKTQV